VGPGTASLDKAAMKQQRRWLVKKVRNFDVIYFIFSQKVRGEARGLVQAADEKGLKAWKHLVQKYELNTKSRSLGSLQQILSFKFSNGQAREFKQLMREDERMSNKKLAQDLKQSVLLSSAPVATRQHLQLHAATPGAH
jgi:hypothetical protein